MNHRSGWILCAAGAALAIPWAACGAGGTDTWPAEGVEICASSWDLIDGKDAPEASFDAVGTLGWIDPDEQRYRPFCSATLVSPKQVLTAKHCTLVRDEPLFFALGYDARVPKRLIAVVDAQVSEPRQGGVSGLGSDIALCDLAEPVNEVVPMRVSGVDAAALIGTSVQTLGYGIAQATCGAVSDWRRRIGEQVLRAAQGNVYDLIYGDRTRYLEAAPKGQDRRAIEERYQRGGLLDGYEVWAEPGREHAQICKGDSGGPVVAVSDRVPEIIGVSSWVWHSDARPCDYGAVIAVLGPATRQLISSVNEAPVPNTY